MKKRNQGTPLRGVQLMRVRNAQREAVRGEMAILFPLLEEWMWQQDLNLNEPYKTRRWQKAVRRILGGPNGPGFLQNRINRHMDGLLDRMRADLPVLTWEDRQLVCFSVIGLSHAQMAALLHLEGAEAVYRRKERLRMRIRRCITPYRDEYLMVLGRKSWRMEEDLPQR